MPTEILMFIMLSVFVVILTILSYSQASSMREMERVVQDYYAMNLRRARRAYGGTLDTINQYVWVSNRLSARQSKPVQIIEVIRSIPEIGAVDLRTNDNRRVVVSVHPKMDILLFDRRTKVSKRSRKSVGDRIADFAVRPVLDGSRYGWGVTTIEVAMSKTDEFFDMEADAVGKKLNVDWKTPTRLYFHVVD